MNLDFDKYYEAPEPGRRERAYAWATAIGLQDVDGLRPSQYLIDTAKRNIEGEISADDARRLVDEYYEVKGEHEIPEDTVEADKVSVRINLPAFARILSWSSRKDIRRGFPACWRDQDGRFEEKGMGAERRFRTVRGVFPD